MCIAALLTQHHCDVWERYEAQDIGGSFAAGVQIKGAT
jgi:hypothetical protein